MNEEGCIACRRAVGFLTTLLACIRCGASSLHLCKCVMTGHWAAATFTAFLDTHINTPHARFLPIQHRHSNTRRKAWQPKKGSLQGEHRLEEAVSSALRLLPARSPSLSPPSTLHPLHAHAARRAPSSYLQTDAEVQLGSALLSSALLSCPLLSCPLLSSPLLSSGCRAQPHTLVARVPVLIPPG